MPRVAKPPAATAAVARPERPLVRNGSGTPATELQRRACQSTDRTDPAASSWRRPAAAGVAHDGAEPSDAQPTAAARDSLIGGAGEGEAVRDRPQRPARRLLRRAPPAPSTSRTSTSTRRRSRELRAAGVALVVPLITNGELIGLLNVGRRLSDQDFSADDRRLLETLAAQAAPAVRVGQLVREQQAEIRARGRIEQELAVAQLIQQNFLPKELPQLDGWQVAAYYRAGARRRRRLLRLHRAARRAARAGDRRRDRQGRPGGDGDGRDHAACCARARSG